MESLKSKLIFISIMFIAIIAMPLLVFAANENIEILVKNDGDGIIYIKGHLDSAFEFAFSNDKNQDKATLSFKSSETDSSTKENHIAYVNDEIANDYFSDSSKSVYFWAKSGEEFFVEAIEINTEDLISESDIDYINQITKRIEINLTTTSSKETKDGVEITTTVGKTELKGEGPFLYQLIKPETESYKNFIKLSERMSKLNSVDTYTELKTYREFSKAFTELLDGIDETKWEEATNNEVLQPQEAQNGEQYVLWLIDLSKDEEEALDVQILTSVREESEKVIKEKVTTKLPVTYDNNTLLIVLSGLVVATIGVSIRIKTLKNNEEK